MGIILRFILRSIRERKFRTFLILFAISLSTALFFASNALSLTMQKMYVEVMKKYSGSSNIIVTPGPKSKWFLYTEGAERHADRLDMIVGCVDGGGRFRPGPNGNVDFYLRGFRIEDLFIFSPVTLRDRGDLYPFVGAKIIIGEEYAKQYGWRLGDSLELEVQGAKRHFQIVGIALSTGVFKEGFDRSLTAVVPRDYLATMYGIRGRVTGIYVRTKSESDIPAMIRLLAQEYGRYSVREPIDKAERERFASNIKTPLLLMTALVLFMSVFIIYSSFKVITVERLPVIGTFRSIGATRKTTDFVLIMETLLYGVLGGLLGCLLGVGVLFLMTNLMAYNPWAGMRMKTEIHFETVHMASAFLIAVALSFVSSIVPIVRVSRIPVKDIVLNKMETEVKKKVPRAILGIAALIVAPLAPLYAPQRFAFPVCAASLFLAVAAVIVLVPSATSLLLRLLQRLYLLVFGNEGVLAAKNLRGNRNVLNNISLLALSISSLILIFTISFSVFESLIGFYSDTRFGVWAWANRADKSTELVLRTIPGVTDVAHAYSVSNVRTGKGDKPINLVQGVDTRSYLDFWDIKVPRELMARLDEGRNILLSTVLKAKFEVEVGDVLTLELKNGKKPYEVIGFFNTMRNGSSFAIVSEKYLKADAELDFYNDLYLKTTKTPEETAGLVKAKMARRYPWVSTVADMQRKDIESNQQLMTLLKGFAVMTLVIGIFGVLNNFIIGFVERKRHLAIMRSVGMSRKQVVKMMFMESLAGGLIGGVMGCAGGGILIFIANYLLISMDLYIDMTVSPPVFLVCLAAAVVISLIASISPALKSSGMNIIEAVKYE